MKSRYLMLAAISVCLSSCRPTQAVESTTIQAKSMVCGSCAKTIEKAVYRVEGVKEVTVDLDRKMVEVKFVSAQTNVQTIEAAISDAGYDANSRKRNPDAYEKLAACCKIDG
jgi:copper ion binding protein